MDVLEDACLKNLKVDFYVYDDDWYRDIKIYEVGNDYFVVREKYDVDDEEEELLNRHFLIKDINKIDIEIPKKKIKSD